jgi:hypothetical protein
MVGLRCRAAQINRGGAATPPYQNKKYLAGNCGAFFFCSFGERERLSFHHETNPHLAFRYFNQLCCAG